MRRRFFSPPAILIVMLPGAVFANVTGNDVTVNANQTLSLETGTGSGTQDIQFTGSAISFQGACAPVRGWLRRPPSPATSKFR